MTGALFQNLFLSP